MRYITKKLKISQKKKRQIKIILFTLTKNKLLSYLWTIHGALMKSSKEYSVNAVQSLNF